MTTTADRPAVAPPAIRRMVRRTLGHEELRPGQEAAIRSVLEGRDTLAVMPTGSGKSAIYQLGGTRLDGATVIVSPLIALQRDQLEAIEEAELGGGAVINSTLRPSETRQAFEDLEEGDVEFVFLAPEQLAKPDVLDRLRSARISLFVVDEAHCISDWGHDFRPDYLRLRAVIESLGRPTVLALTATAAPPVREEIAERLGMRDPAVIVAGFDRPNIWLGVERFPDEPSKRRAFVEHVEAERKPGIVYVATRKRAEELAAALSELGIGAVAYHAGMNGSDRSETQRRFMEDEAEVIVATTAFGMGIDKPNVRFVLHYDASEAVDSYYQEVGRAGRDGEDARALLLYRPEDLGVRRYFAAGGRLRERDVVRVLGSIGLDETVEVAELRDRTGLSRAKLTGVLTRLEEASVVRLDGTRVIPVEARPDVDALMREAEADAERRHRVESSRIEMMRGYAELSACRRQYLLDYFGEGLADPCGSCDNCESGRSDALAVEAAEAGQPFAVGSRVVHAQWGAGDVMRYEGDRMVVLFGERGYKTLSVELVEERGLLRVADGAAPTGDAETGD